MFHIDPEAIYSLDELEKNLTDIVSLSTFLDRLKLRDRRVFREAVWGWEIIEASRRAQPFSLRDHPASKLTPSEMRPNARRPKRAKVSPAGRLSVKDL